MPTDSERPPTGWRTLLAVVLPADGRSEIAAELEARFAREQRRFGARAARRWYRAQVLRTLLPAARERRRRLRLGVTRGSRTLASDLRGGIRQCLRHPATSLAMIGLITLGSGVAATLGSILHRALLTPLDHAESERLVLLWGRTANRPTRFPLPAPDVARVRESTRSLTGLAFVLRAADMGLALGERARHVRVGVVTHDLFDLLGARAHVGRTFGAADATLPSIPDTDDEGAPAPPLPVVLSHGLWRELAGGDTRIVGRQLRLDGAAARVTGVLEPGFMLDLPRDAGWPGRIDAWVPLRTTLPDFARDEGRLIDQDSDNAGVSIGRLAPGATVAALRAELDALAVALGEQLPGYAEQEFAFESRHWSVALADDAADLVRAGSLAVAVLLLVCWVNASTLWLAALARRVHELAVRGALGASAGRLRRELFAEWCVTAGVGLLAGVGGSTLLLPGLRAVAAGRLPGMHTGGPEPTVLVGTLLAALVAGTTITLPWMWVATRPAPPSGARGGATLRQLRLRRGFVVVQVALSVMLLSAAGLLGRSAAELSRVDAGFDETAVLTFRMSLRSEGRYRGPAERAALVAELTRAVETLPGVRAVGVVGRLPLAGGEWTQPWGRPETPPDSWGADRAELRMVTSGYFEAMGIELRAGRAFTSDEDLIEAHRVVVVDTEVARRLDPEGSALGGEIGVPIDGRPVRARIVGIVAPVRHVDLKRTDAGAIYVPYRQEASRDVAFAVRTAAAVEPTEVVDAVRRAVSELDPALPVYDLIPMRDHVRGVVEPTRVAARLLGVFGLIGALSSAVGLYGVLAVLVGRRRREIGVRIALGASPGRMLRTILGDGLRAALLGIAAGTPLALVAIRQLEGSLFGVGALDPWTWSAVLLGTSSLTLLATIGPARRAANTEPRAALTAEP